MIKIEALNKDLLYGDFTASSYGLVIGSLSHSGDSSDDIGMGITTMEEFIGHEPVPVYIGQKYSEKLKLQITLVKDPCIFRGSMYFNEKDCRSILRTLTGQKGYRWMKLVTWEPDGDLWYRARIGNISYERIGGHIAGIILDLECDSCFAWSQEYQVTVQARAGMHFYVFNNTTDDLNNYVYPLTEITSASAGSISVVSLSDNSRCCEIKNVRQNEKITVDAKRQIISSSLPHELLLDDFNLGWPRLVPDKNEFVSDSDIIISMKYRVPRKAGIIE